MADSRFTILMALFLPNKGLFTNFVMFNHAWKQREDRWSYFECHTKPYLRVATILAWFWWLCSYVNWKFYSDNNYYYPKIASHYIAWNTKIAKWVYTGNDDSYYTSGFKCSCERDEYNDVCVQSNTSCSTASQDGKCQSWLTSELATQHKSKILANSHHS